MKMPKFLLLLKDYPSGKVPSFIAIPIHRCVVKKTAMVLIIIDYHA